MHIKIKMCSNLIIKILYCLTINLVKANPVSYRHNVSDSDGLDSLDRHFGFLDVLQDNTVIFDDGDITISDFNLEAINDDIRKDLDNVMKVMSTPNLTDDTSSSAPSLSYCLKSNPR